MNFVCIVFEFGDKMLTLSSMENLMCKIWRQILIFWGEFFTVGGQEKYFLVSA